MCVNVCICVCVVKNLDVLVDVFDTLLSASSVLLLDDATRTSTQCACVVCVRVCNGIINKQEDMK